MDCSCMQASLHPENYNASDQLATKYKKHRNGEHNNQDPHDKQESKLASKYIPLHEMAKNSILNNKFWKLNK